MKCKCIPIILFVALLGPVELEGQQLEEAAQEVANQISLSLIAEGKKNIAVLPFTDLRNNSTPVGEAFSEELFNRLFRLRQGKFEIVERSKIGAIWKEQRDFSDQWLLDNMANFSSLLGADSILVGTHFELDEYHRINARLLAVPSGKFLATASTRMQTLDGLETGSGAGKIEEEADGDPLGTPVSSSEGGGIRVDLLPCELSGDKLTCEFLVTSIDKDQDIYLRRARLIERSAKQVAPTALTFGASSSSGSQVYAELVRGIPLRGSATFAGLDGSLAKNGISLIEMSFDQLKAQFRDVRPK